MASGRVPKTNITFFIFLIITYFIKNPAGINHSPTLFYLFLRLAAPRRDTCKVYLT